MKKFGGTADFSDEIPIDADASSTIPLKGTIPVNNAASLSPSYGQIQGQEAASEEVPTMPLPSKPRDIIRGQSIAKWSVDRRRTAKTLFVQWQQASAAINKSSFGVYIDTLMDEIEKQMPLFRDVPFEETFSGILQLIQQFLRENLDHIQNQRAVEIVNTIFSQLQKEKLSLNDFKNTLALMQQIKT